MHNALSVRLKIFLTVLIGVIALSAFAYFISTRVLFQSYIDIERDEVVEDIRRAEDAIHEFARQQTVKLKDWSQWQDSYNYAKGEHATFVEENLTGPTILNLDLTLMAYFDTAGALVGAFAVSPETGDTVLANERATPFLTEERLVHHETLEEQTEGLLLVSGSPYVVSSLPLLQTDGSGPFVGSLVFVRILDEEKTREIGNLTHLSLDLFPYNSNALPEDVAYAKARLTETEPYAVVPASKEFIQGYSVLRDINGAPALLLRINNPRPVFTQGELSFILFTGIGAVVLVLFGLFIGLLLERLVIARFVRLTKAVEKINTVHDLSIRVEGGEPDEIGKLAEKINQMLRWLSRSKKAEEASKDSVVKLLGEIRKGKDEAEEMVRLRTHELADEKARLLASIHSLSLGFVIVDTQGAVLLSNPALAKITESRKAPASIEDIGKMLRKDTSGSESRFDFAAFVKESMAQGVPREQRNISFGKKFLRLFCAPIFSEDTTGDDAPDGIGCVLLLEDVTEAKNLERSKEEFFSIASHELRTPLAAIRGNAELLLDFQKGKRLDARTRQMLTDINIASERLIAIVNDFLEVSRLEQGRIEIRREPVDVVELAQGVAHALSELAHVKKLTLSVRAVGGPMPTVVSDRERLEQVLDNLVGNAVKFTETGGVIIEVERAVDAVLVRVIDTGIGVSAHNQTRLFRKFHQAGEQLLARDVSQGTGLGLYISKLIMDALRGTVYLERSELGKGSAFVISIPVS